MAGNLLALRSRRFMTQVELAKAAGVSPTTINRVETGKMDPRFSTIKKLAAALGVTPEELAGPAE